MTLSSVGNVRTGDGHWTLTARPSPLDQVPTLSELISPNDLSMTQREKGGESTLITIYLSQRGEGQVTLIVPFPHGSP
jgi:hypothetical protein